MAVGSKTDFTLRVSGPAAKDIIQIAKGDKAVEVKIWVAINELKADQRLLEKLLEDHYGQLTTSDRHTHPIGVQKIDQFQVRERPRRDTWRWKFWDLENEKGGPKVRFVYMYIPKPRWFVVLAAAPRKWNYDPHHPLSQRIRDDYDRFSRDYG